MPRSPVVTICRGRWRTRRAPRAAASALVALVATVALGALAGCDSSQPVPQGAFASPAPTRTRPNIVFVLTDDLSTNLIQYMPHVRALAQAGMSFANYTVTDSLCCPSRASILTGAFPHDTGIFTNSGTDGGFLPFHDRGEEANTFGAKLHEAGYRTAFMGKYLNKYTTTFPEPVSLGTLTPPAATFVPPGWDEWDGVGYGYTQYDYTINHDHTVLAHGSAPADYLNTVLQNYATTFISDSARQAKPFLLEVASFSPHIPYTPAPSDLNTFPTVTAPRTAAFDRLPLHAPHWLAPHQPLTAQNIAGLDAAYRLRVESVQSVDRMIGALENTLAATGQLADTVFVFSSDNGYHMGEHRLLSGKLTAFDTDIRVPLVVAGPGIPAGAVTSEVAENVDLAPTFEDLAGAKLGAEVDGHSLVPLLHGEHPAWRTLALVEHHGPDTEPDDPDRQTVASADPPTYTAIRSPAFIYVRYVTGDREYYDLTKDPDELDNVYGTLSPSRRAQLDAEMDALQACRGPQQCWTAASPAP